MFLKVIMELIKPITYAETQLISSTATETYSAWSSATSYAIGARVTYNYRIYESVIGSNLNNNPATATTAWLNYAPDNKHAMFDTQVSTVTTSTGTLTTVLKPGMAFNSLALLNLTGTSMNVKIQNGVGGTEVYNSTISLDETIISDWYSYFFEPYDFKSEVVLTNLPAYLNGTITLTLSTTGSSGVSIGAMIPGSLYNLGGTQYGARIGIKDYSVKTTDAYGNTTFVQRAYSKQMEATVYVNAEDLNLVYKLLTDVRSVPSVWIGSEADSLKPLVVFGYYRDFGITIQYPTYSLCTLSIEGLI